MIKAQYLLFSFFAIFISISIGSGEIFASLYVGKNTIRSQQENAPSDEKAYRNIFLRLRFDDFNMSVPFYKRWQKYCDLYIGAFENFVLLYPKSAFVPEAKLRIAEFYHLSYRKHRARKWLDDVIKNHSSDKHYSLHKKYKDGDWTAAWALYYRGKWFNREDDLKKIKISYPESRVLDKENAKSKTKISIRPLLFPSRK